MRLAISTVLQSLLALALVALFSAGVHWLRQPDGNAAPAPTEAATDDAAEPELPAPEVTHDPARNPSGDIGDWRPDVDQVIDQLEDILISDIPQQQLNYTMANLNAVYDTKLYLVFIDYLATLAPDQAKTALKEQEDWLRQRKEDTAAVYAEGDGGSLAPYNAGETYLQATRQRLEVLEQRLPH